MVGSRHTCLHPLDLEHIFGNLLGHTEKALPGHEVLAMIRMSREVRSMHKYFISREQRPHLVRACRDKISAVRNLLVSSQNLLTDLLQSFL